MRILKCSVIGLAAGQNVDLLSQQIAEFQPRFVSCQRELPNLPGKDFLPPEEIARHPEVDIVLSDLHYWEGPRGVEIEGTL